MMIVLMESFVENLSGQPAMAVMLAAGGDCNCNFSHSNSETVEIIRDGGIYIKGLDDIYCSGCCCYGRSIF